MSHAPRRSLESLKKEAKRWHRELEAGDPRARARYDRVLPGSSATTSTLRDVQHALARELGFAGWAALKMDLADGVTTPPPTLELYQRMAHALLEAYQTGSVDAMERYYSYVWHRREWRGMRTYVQLDLGRRPQNPDDPMDISLADVQLLVAREHGFTDWQDLTDFVANVPPRSAFAVQPVRIRSWSSARIRDDGMLLGPPDVLVTRDWGEALERLSGAHTASFDADGQMTDELLRRIARYPAITSLSLGGSKAVTDDGIRHLAALPRLKHLTLGGTRLTDRGLEVLEEMPQLESLRINQTAVTDAGMRHLSHCNNLSLLDAMWTTVGDGAIRAMAGKKAFSNFISGNGVTDAGLAALHQLPAFTAWQEAHPGIELMSYDAGTNSLSLRGNFTDRGMQQLRGLDGLFALNLDAAELRLTSAALEPLVDLPNFGWLAFDAKDDAMPVIASMPRLRFLGCQDSACTDAAWTALGKSQSIEYIWGRRCHGLRTEGFAALSKIPTLKGLSVSCLNVEDRGIALLPDFPALRELMPMDVPDAGYRHIGRCHELERLVLMYCRDTTDAAMEHLAGMPKLQRYFVSYNLSTDRTPEILSGIDSLLDVTIDAAAGVTDAGIRKLRRLPRLQQLRVSGPQITAAAGQGFRLEVLVSIN